MNTVGFYVFNLALWSNLHYGKEKLSNYAHIASIGSLIPMQAHSEGRK